MRAAQRQQINAKFRIGRPKKNHKKRKKTLTVRAHWLALKSKKEKERNETYIAQVANATHCDALGTTNNLYCSSHTTTTNKPKRVA